MNIGQLNTPASGIGCTLRFHRGGGKLLCEPEKTAAGMYRWSWTDTMLTDVELHMTFEKKVFAASIRLEIKGALTCAQIFVPAETGEKAVGIHRAETGNTFTGTVVIPVGTVSDTFILRLTPALTHLELPEPAVIGMVPDEPLLYPTPDTVQWGEGKLPLEMLDAAAAEEHPDCVFALSYYKERLAETVKLYTIPAAWMRTVPAPKPAAAGSAVVKICHAEDIVPDGYRLNVTETGAVLEASNRLGLLYAIERLMEMTTADGAPCCVVEDKPYKEMRGFHFGLPPREEIPFLKNLLKTILIPYHYNQLIMEFAGGMRFLSHPEISEAWLEGNRKSRAGEIPTFPHGSMNSGGELLEQEEVREFCDYARELGFELIPEVQSFGHVQYITYAHPDIAETDESVTERQMDTRNTDQPPSTYYHHSYCPQNPKSYEIIYDLIDEIVDVVRPPRFVHMGHDEIYQMGLCPKCKDVPHDQLYEMHVTALHSYLAKKGLRMMLWADMLQPTERYKSWPAIERLPRDIVLLDFIWYFHFDLDMEDHLLPYGYDVMMGNLYSSHYPRYESRAAKGTGSSPGESRMIGGQVSTWCRMDEYTLAKKGKFYDLLYTGEMLWSPTYREDAREAYAHILAGRIPTLRDRIRGLGDIAREYRMLDQPETAGRVPSALREACLTVGRNSCLLSAPVTVHIHEQADALRFLHTTLREEKRIAWEPLTVVGTYTVQYSDGTEEVILVEYDGNIRCWRDRFASPKPAQYYRHQGYVCTWTADPVLRAKTEDGEDVVVMGFEWKNPYPDKRIETVVCRETETSAAGLVLCGVDMVTYVKK